METVVDMKGYKVHYNGHIFDAICCIPDMGLKLQRTSIIPKTFITVIILEGHGRLVSLYDNSEKFVFKEKS